MMIIDIKRDDPYISRLGECGGRIGQAWTFEAARRAIHCRASADGFSNFAHYETEEPTWVWTEDMCDLLSELKVQGQLDGFDPCVDGRLRGFHFLQRNYPLDIRLFDGVRSFSWISLLHGHYLGGKFFGFASAYLYLYWVLGC